MTTVRKSAATDGPYRRSREMYEQGAPLSVLKRKMHLTEGELRDIAPEEFPDDPEPEGGAGGY